MTDEDKFETIVFTDNAGFKIVSLYETLDKLRKGFVNKDGALGFMFTDTADRPYNGLERGLLYTLYTAAGIEEFCLTSSTVYDTVEEQAKDNQGTYFK
jgi:hypothetical protein